MRRSGRVQRQEAETEKAENAEAAEAAESGGAKGSKDAAGSEETKAEPSNGIGCDGRAPAETLPEKAKRGRPEGDSEKLGRSHEETQRETGQLTTTRRSNRHGGGGGGGGGGGATADQNWGTRSSSAR